MRAFSLIFIGFLSFPLLAECPESIEQAGRPELPAQVKENWQTMLERFYSAKERGFHGYGKMNARQLEFIGGVLLPILGEAVLFRDPSQDTEEAFRPWKWEDYRVVLDGVRGKYPKLGVVWSPNAKKIRVDVYDDYTALVLPERFRWSPQGIAAFVPEFFPNWLAGHPFGKLFQRFLAQPHAEAAFTHLPLVKQLTRGASTRTMEKSAVELALEKGLEGTIPFDKLEVGTTIVHPQLGFLKVDGIQRDRDGGTISGTYRGKPVTVPNQEKLTFAEWETPAANELAGARAQSLFSLQAVAHYMFFRAISEALHAPGLTERYSDWLKELGKKDLPSLQIHLMYRLAENGIGTDSKLMSLSAMHIAPFAEKVFEETGEDLVRAGILLSMGETWAGSWSFPFGRLGPTANGGDFLQGQLKFIPLEVNNYLREELWKLGRAALRNEATPASRREDQFIHRYLPETNAEGATNPFTDRMIELTQNHSRDLARRLVRASESELRKLLPTSPNTVFTYVPGRWEERSPSALLANAVVSELALPYAVSPVVGLSPNRFSRPTKTLRTLAMRLGAVSGKFSVLAPELVQGRDVVVLDDIVSSGITSEEIRRILLRAGARSVQILHLGHTKKPARAAFDEKAFNAALPPQPYTVALGAYVPKETYGESDYLTSMLDLISLYPSLELATGTVALQSETLSRLLAEMSTQMIVPAPTFDSHTQTNPLFAEAIGVLFKIPYARTNLQADIRGKRVLMITARAGTDLSKYDSVRNRLKQEGATRVDFLVLGRSPYRDVADAPNPDRRIKKLLLTYVPSAERMEQLKEQSGRVRGAYEALVFAQWLTHTAGNKELRSKEGFLSRFSIYQDASWDIKKSCGLDIGVKEMNAVEMVIYSRLRGGGFGLTKQLSTGTQRLREEALPVYHLYLSEPARRFLGTTSDHLIKPFNNECTVAQLTSSLAPGNAGVTVQLNGIARRGVASARVLISGAGAQRELRLNRGDTEALTKAILEMMTAALANPEASD